jgi:YVTN family beta-propeller protein
MDGVVIAFPYTTEIDQTILAGHAPGPMAVTDTSPSYLLVSNPDSNSVTVLDVNSRKLVAVVQVGQGPGQIVITPDRPQQYALVLNEKSGDMAVIRLVKFAEPWARRNWPASLFTLIPVGEEPVAAAVVKVG